MFTHITAAVDVADADVADYHARNPLRFAAPSDAGGWHRGRWTPRRWMPCAR